MSESNNSKFATRKWNIVNNVSIEHYGVGNEIAYNVEVLKLLPHQLLSWVKFLSFCDCNDIYISVRGEFTVAPAPAKQLSFKNYAPFTIWITKIDRTTIDHAEEFDLVMKMYDLIECSSSYSQATGSLWFYSKDEATIFNADIANDNNFESFSSKVKLSGNTESDGANGILKNATIAVPLKYSSNLSRSIEMLLINCKGELKSKSTINCFVSSW